MPSLSTSSVYRIALLALILGGFALRIYKLDSQSLWYDEGVTAIVAQYDLSSLARWTADDIQPPLYYELVAGWGRLAGWGEWSLRFASAFCGLLIVPLLAALAMRWNRSRLAAVLAALLTTAHPLLVYYSQEARMYTLLMTLGVGIAYCILRIADEEAADSNAEAQRRKDRQSDTEHSSPHPLEGKNTRRIGVFWLSYVFLAAAALYTHYFAAFLLLAVNIAYLLDMLSTSRSRFHDIPHLPSPISHLPSWLLANAAVVILYLPWVGNLLTRLDVDASYWEGSLKLWEALRAVAIRFTSGETVLEGEATRLLWMYAAVTLLALFGAVWQAEKGTRRQGDKVTGPHSSRFMSHVSRFPFYALSNLQYPLLLLLIPIAAVLTLASFTPKFNARYVMVALPGLLLVWSAGLAGLLRSVAPIWQRLQRVACNSEPRALPAIAGLVGTGLLLAGFVQADRNWFTDTAFTKDQWREVAAFVQGQMEANDAVVLVSGHAWPVWRYYAPDIEPVRLPEIETLDVHAVVDLDNSAQSLRPALLDKHTAWLVDWQDEVVDPTDAAGLQLRRAGDEQPIDAQFWGIRLRRFVNLDARIISNAPPIQKPTRANFGDTVELLGHSVEKGGDLLLFWRLTQDTTPLPDLHLTAETRTANGLLFARIGDRRLSAYDFPTFRWQIGQIVAGRLPAASWIGAGAPVGNYQLRLGVYDPAGDPAGLDLLGPAGERLGKRATITVALSQPIPLSPDENPLTWHPIVDGLFVRPILVNSRAAAGESIVLQTLWFAQEARRVDHLVVRWNNPQHRVQWNGTQMTVDLDLPANQAIRTVYQIPVPLDLPPGDYGLELSAAITPTRPVELPVTILSSNRNFSLPSLDPALSAVFGRTIVLAGLAETKLPERVAPGAILPLTLIWQAVSPVATDYAMSVQWLNADGRPVGQRDGDLPRGSSTWLHDEVVAQTIKLAAPQQPGEYRLIVAVYDARRSGLPRLRLADGEDYVEIGWVEVQP